MAKVFIAKFSGGKCSECETAIEAGDEVSYAVDILLHAECNDGSFWDDSDLLDGDYDD